MRKCAWVLLMCLLALTLTGCGDSVSSREHPEAYVRTMDYRDGFTVLQLSDIHWDGGTPVALSKAYIKKLVAEAENHAGRIDLIELTGDTFMLANTRLVDSFIDLMEEIGIPYAIVWGNHDHEGTYNPSWLTRSFLSAPYCVYAEVDDDDVSGRSNYVINLMDGEEVAWQLFQLDSGASWREDARDISLTYDYLRPDQFEWMALEHELAGEDVPSLCWYHIPQADQDIAWEESLNGAGFKTGFFKLEEFAASRYAPRTRESFAACHVKGAFSAHAHANDWAFTSPEGIVYALGVKTGKELYYGKLAKGDSCANYTAEEDMDLIGAALVTLEDRGGNMKLEHLYFNERDGGDLAVWVAY